MIFDEEDAEVLRFDNFDDAVECCAATGYSVLSGCRKQKLVFWFCSCVDDEGYRNSPLVQAGVCNHSCRYQCRWYVLPECGTVHWPDGVTRLMLYRFADIFSGVTAGNWLEKPGRFSASGGIQVGDKIMACGTTLMGYAMVLFRRRTVATKDLAFRCKAHSCQLRG